MKKLFLTSSFKDVASLFKNFDKDTFGKKVTFITTASKVEKVIFYVQAGKKALEKMGMIVEELDITDTTFEEIKIMLQRNDYIYFTGGNTFFLLQEIKRKGIEKIIIDEVQNGKTFIGESAGAMILSPDIEYVKEMDNPKVAPELKDYASLNLVDFFTVPHFNSFPFKESVEKIIENYSNTLNLKIIDNNQAIIVEGDSVKII